MSSSKSKKESGKIPKPIKIKKEDDHILYPMEHYVDDRVELIRQIFSSLKPKTITNLAPEFLKKNKLEDIQEQCLNEILGISKKRLLSVINSSKCPTDTETSDDEVHNVDEHISLEEISSDSDFADQKGGKSSSKGDGKRKSKIKNDADNTNNKQFSVLELLELQARARAIRSQLALEPVTKIEVGTDSEEDEPLSKKETPSRKEKTSNSRSSSSKSDAAKRPASAASAVAKANGELTSSGLTKRIKLKRNFRKQIQDEDSNDEVKKIENPSKSVESVEPKKEARSPSPDVIPIIAVPETLCISDSDDENTTSAKELPVEVSNTGKSSSRQVEILSIVNIETPKSMSSQIESEAHNPEAHNDSPKASTETEEGEILEDEYKHKETKEVISPKDQESVTEKESNKMDETKSFAKSKEHSKSDKNSSAETITGKPQSVDCSNSDSDSNDDVISLEGGDLLNEMKEHLEDDIDEPIETTKPQEIICLDDSSEEESKTKNKKVSESWNERWLKSSKVSKVLATSRLGNRVRNKIKESKKAKKLKDEAAILEAEQIKPQDVIFTSKHEDGSVEQYKEILDNSQKKMD